MSIFRFSAEFRFFFFFFYFPLFLKNRQNCFFVSLPTPPLSTVRRASVKSRWRLGLPVCAFPFPVEVRGRSSKRRIYTPAAMLRVGVHPWLPRRRGGEGDGLVAGWRTGSKWDGGRARSDRKSFAHRTPAFAELHPLPFHPHHFTHTHTHTHTHSLSLSLSLSLIHTHTHTFRAAHWYDFAVTCSGQSLHATLAPKMLRSLAEKSTWFYFLAQRLNGPPLLSSPFSLSLSLSKHRSFAKSKPNLLRRIASFYEDAVMCSLSIAPRQTCARGRGHHHFELWPVGRPGAAEEEGREGWRWMTRTVEGGGWGCLDLSLFFHTLFSFAKTTHTYTHIHTHTHFSFFFLVIIRAHTYTVTI